MPATDPRFTNATMTDILNDLMEIDVGAYMDKFESHDEETNAFAKAQALRPLEAARQERERIAASLTRFLSS